VTKNTVNLKKSLTLSQVMSHNWKKDEWQDHTKQAGGLHVTHNTGAGNLLTKWLCLFHFSVSQITILEI